VFLGKAAIYSAGITFMSFFARDNRYLTRGTRLMIHERKLDKTLKIDGPLTSCVATVKATLNEIEASIAIQNEGFENLTREPNVTMEQVGPAELITCENDEEALHTAGPLVNGYDVELWQGDRIVTRIRTKAS
jgi:hypothetical protein